jgi:predicted phage tail protein
MQLVMLAGELGEKYGTHHEYYNLRTPADAIKLLCLNHPKLQKDLMTAHQNGVGYKLIQSGAAMGYDELHLPFGSRPMMLVPVISGSGGSTTQILIGVGLVAASFLFPGAGLFGASAFGAFGGPIAAAGTLTTVGTAISAVGASLILGGVANMISPQPELPKLGSRRMDGTNFRGPGPQGVSRGASGQQSYAYTGPANTVGNGSTIPVVYGRAMIGGHMLSVGVEAADVSDPIATAIKAPGPDTILIAGEKVEREFDEEAGIATRSITRGQVNSVNTTKTNRRIVIDPNVGFGPGLDKTLAENSTKKMGNVDVRGTFQDEFDIIFEVKKGLFGRSGAAATSTKIDGFIQYRIEVEHTMPGNDINVAGAEVTIQGYLEATQNYFYLQRLKWRKLDNNKELKLRITIMDVDTDAPTRFRVHAFGYRLLD